MHNRKGGGRLEKLQAELVALDANAATLNPMQYGMARQELLAQIASFDTPEVQAEKQKKSDAQKATDSKESAKWLADLKVLDAAQAQREKKYQDGFVRTPYGWRPIQPGETPEAQYPK
jgi:hypothetical protein